jgi:predicted enzyme related to lactoylglutathione lyase
MANQHGDFVWYELLTSDPDAAVRFYSAVIGWKTRSAGEPYGGYRIFGMGAEDVGGLTTIPADSGRAGIRPGWLGYIGVRDVDATVAEVTRAGGTQHVSPTDIPGIGRFAMVADPQGVVFYVMRGAVEGKSTAFAPTKTGHCHWNELTTTDQDAALAFYTSLFGWEKGDGMPMGERGIYRFIHHDGATIGAMMNRWGDGPPPAWNFYFGVEDIDKAARAIADNGGAIHHGPAEVPGGIFIVVATDPQGGLFGLVGPRRQ